MRKDWKAIKELIQDLAASSESHVYRSTVRRNLIRTVFVFVMNAEKCGQI